MSSSLLMQGYHNGTLLPTQTLIFGYPVSNLKPDVLYKIRFDSMRCICSCNRYNKLIVKSSVCLFLALTIKILALSPYLPLQIRPKPLFYLRMNLKDNFGVQTITILVVSQNNLSTTSFLFFSTTHLC